MALIKRAPTIGDYRRAFFQASQAVVDYRAQFDVAFEAAQTDSERHQLATSFPANLAHLYYKVDRILDHYLESPHVQLQ